MRLIDTDALLEHLEACLTNGRPVTTLYDLREIVNYVESMPTIEAVTIREIVKCKDCKYGITQGITDGFVFCSKPYTERGSAMHRPDWFCADGKAR